MSKSHPSAHNDLDLIPQPKHSDGYQWYKVVCKSTGKTPMFVYRRDSELSFKEEFTPKDNIDITFNSPDEHVSKIMADYKGWLKRMDGNLQ